MDSQETKTNPVWMLTAAVVIILAGSVLWGYNGQSENIHQTAFKPKLVVRPSSIQVPLSSIKDKKAAITVVDSALLSKSKNKKDTLVKIADNKPFATTLILNTDSFDGFEADDDNTPAPLNESIVMAYNVKKADTTPLNESVVMTYNAQRKVQTGKLAIIDIATVSNNAVYPQTGWEVFGRYINDKAVSPDNKTGVVELAFTITANGLLCDFKITQSLNDTADKAAVDLVKNGTAWTNNTAGQPATVTLKVSFHAATKS